MKTITLENGTKVKISQASYNELAKAVKPTYKPGQRFLILGEEYILADLGNSGVTLICLRDGITWSGLVKVRRAYEITENEMNRLVETPVSWTLIQ